MIFDVIIMPVNLSYVIGFCLFVCLFVCLSFSLFFCLSVCLFILCYNGGIYSRKFCGSASENAGDGVTEYKL
jgi:hypothetical protein